MKTLHRTKALETYSVARITLKEEKSYSSYVMLKECLRATLSYILEDTLNMEISDKTKLVKLLNLVPEPIIDEDSKKKFNFLLEAEKTDLNNLLTLDLDKLKEVKKALKKVIGNILEENL